MIAWAKRRAVLGLMLGLPACGGNVNLGHRDGTMGQTPDEPTGEVPGDPKPIEPEHVSQLADINLSGNLAVAGEYLYLNGFRDNQSGLFRCKKTSCGSSLEHLPSANGAGVLDLQVQGDRLGVVLSNNATSRIASFSLPGGEDARVLIDQLPRGFDVLPLFYGGFVFWGLESDDSYYRCVFPDCAGGPRKLASGRIGRPSADGNVVFAAMDGRILRVAQLGDGPVERLRADATLSVTPPEEADQSLTDADDHADLVVAGGGLLYAALRSTSCVSPCRDLIVRWPVNGGPRETIAQTEYGLRGLQLLGQELVWFDGEGGLFGSCRVEACAATSRSVGYSSQGVAADDLRLYWVENTASTRPSVHSIGRLPKP